MFVDINEHSTTLCNSPNLCTAMDDQLTKMGNTFTGPTETTEWTMVRTEEHFPQQEDGNSCGMFTMMAMVCVCEGENPMDCVWHFAKKDKKDDDPFFLDSGQKDSQDHRMAVACSMDQKISMHSSLKI